MRDTIEFIYEPTCPNIEAARAALRQALLENGKPPVWREWDSTAPTSPPHARAYGSPTILVNGVDVAGVAPSHAPTCRIYRDHKGRGSGVPSVELIAAALRAPTPRARSLGGFAVLPTLGVSLLPKLTCAACWPAYSAALAALGVGFVDYTPYLGWLMTAAIGVTGVVLIRQAWRQRRFGPLLLGSIAAAILVLAKFWIEHEELMYLGAVLLASATLWSAWSVRDRACTSCVRQATR